MRVGVGLRVGVPPGTAPFRRSLDHIGRLSFVAGSTDAYNYVMGMMTADGLKDSLTYKVLDGATACTSKMTRGQVLAIVEKFMNDNPARWHQLMVGLVFEALNEACRSQSR